MTFFLIDKTTPTSVAVDWVSDNLYWSERESDGEKIMGKILVAKGDGRYKRSIITTNLENPTSIVLDPELGRLFWADGGSQPKIEGAWMDGSRRKAIVSTRLGKPSALTIDHAMDHTLYWADIKLNTIESIQKDGSNRKIILHGENLRYPVNKKNQSWEKLAYTHCWFKKNT